MFVFNFPDVGEGIHEGRVVDAQGWVLAESEAKLYALVALVDEASERGA